MKSTLILIGAVLLALVSLFLIFNAFFRPARPPAPRIETPTPSTGIAPSAPAVRGRDVGRGVPDGPCATSRLGESFTRDGVTYVCSGPKPYRWRAQK